MKEHSKNLEDKINEEEIGNLPEKEFRIMTVKIIQDLGKIIEAKIEKVKQMLNKDLEELKDKKPEMNNTIYEMKNTLEVINSRKTETEERVSDLNTDWWNSLPQNRIKKKE